MNANTNPPVPTFKSPSPSPGLAKESQQSNTAASSNSLASLEPAESSRKKSGFVITRIDKASISSALENESDMENEPYIDRGSGAGNRSPGSSSVISENSSIFDDAMSPEKAAVPSITLHGSTPVISCPPRPAGPLPPPGLKPLNAILANVQEQENALGTGGLTPSSAPTSVKDASSSGSTSRFHIIKIDTGPYKRGRWNCRDFDESCSNLPSSATRSDMIAVGGPRSGSSNCSSGKQSYYVVEENGRATAGGDGPQTPLLLLATAMVGNAIDQHHIQPTAPSISDSQQHRAVSPLPNDHHPINLVIHEQETSKCISGQIEVQNASPSFTDSAPQQVLMAPKAKFSAPPSVDLGNAAVAILDSIMVGRRQQQDDHLSTHGENRDASLIAGSLRTVGDGAASEMVQSSGPPTAGGASVAIDNKIEQAMDLVKTHLLYAVREEVEVLKEKIIDLEKKVFRLETENKLLREYAPPEILQQIQQSGVGQTVSTYLNSPVGAPHQSIISPSSPNLQAIAASTGLPAIIGPAPSALSSSMPFISGPDANPDASTTANTLPSLSHQQPPSSS